MRTGFAISLLSNAEHVRGMDSPDGPPMAPAIFSDALASAGGELWVQAAARMRKAFDVAIVDPSDWSPLLPLPRLARSFVVSLPDHSCSTLLDSFAPGRLSPMQPSVCLQR
uniref:Uncharacterized protein n=1 Tax=Noctiluca scintillans TaxID=2966 RepID=A0A7S1AM50_NOCSC|mmetsp:Transcript_5207/g.14715  ORF Transcript_5207/g.14715 Transcript_5207/m.14715 type:complete len:111 (+) Transcript_5207:74-406(+)